MSAASGGGVVRASCLSRSHHEFRLAKIGKMQVEKSLWTVLEAKSWLLEEEREGLGDSVALAGLWDWLRLSSHGSHHGPHIGNDVLAGKGHENEPERTKSRDNARGLDQVAFVAACRMTLPKFQEVMPTSRKPHFCMSAESSGGEGNFETEAGRYL
jgi:hypothetical protein